MIFLSWIDLMHSNASMVKREDVKSVKRCCGWLCVGCDWDVIEMICDDVMLLMWYYWCYWYGVLNFDILCYPCDIKSWYKRRKEREKEEQKGGERKKPFFNISQILPQQLNDGVIDEFVSTAREVIAHIWRSFVWMDVWGKVLNKEKEKERWIWANINLNLIFIW